MGNNEVESELNLEEYMANPEAEEVAEVDVDETPDYLKDIPEEDRKYAEGWNPNYKGENAKTLKQFINDGKLISKVEYLSKKDKERESEFNERLRNLDKLHQIQLKKQREELEERFKDAVNMSDMEEVRAVQKEIDELEDIQIPSEQPKISQDDLEFIQEWDIKNQWIKAADTSHPNYDPLSPDVPKALFAQKLINDLARQGLKPRALAAEVERQVNEKFAVRTKQVTPKHLPSQTLAGAKAKSRGLSWSEISDADKALYNQMPDVWGSKEDYLQALADQIQSSRG